MERFRSLILYTAAAFLILLCGCGGAKQEAMTSAAFDSAPADLKEKWQLASQCAADNDYLGAVTNLTVLYSRAPALTTEQSNALHQAWTDIGNRAFLAAEEGDKRAVQAVMQIKTSAFAKGPGQR